MNAEVRLEYLRNKLGDLIDDDDDKNNVCGPGGKRKGIRQKSRVNQTSYSGSSTTVTGNGRSVQQRSSSSASQSIVSRSSIQIRKDRDEDCPPIKRLPITPVSPVVPPNDVIAEPNPVSDPDNELSPDIVSPDPPIIESPEPPPAITRPRWDSRIGYFIAVSDITWYSEVPRIQESPNVDLHFLNEPDQYLSLSPGESWQSDWYSTGVIRGLDISVVGKHKLNYSKNGDFET